MSMITIIVVMIMVVNMYQLEQFQSWIYRRPPAATTPVSVVVFAVVTKAEALVVKATAVSVSVQCLDLWQTFTAATVLASIQCMLALPESTLCYTSDATALASIDPASADHNPPSHQRYRGNFNPYVQIVMMLNLSILSVHMAKHQSLFATVPSHQRHRCSANL
jgi:hypothetical protein